MNRTLRVGTRGSALARAQAEEVTTRLLAAHPALRYEVVVVRTEGDETVGAQSAGKRVFTKGIEDALLEGHVDVAVHSLKDLPTESTDGLVLAAIPERADPRDALVTDDDRALDALPARAKVGTSSLRRRAQLLAERPGLVVVELRGNVDTRVRRLARGDVDALVVALAGFQRLRIAAPRARPIDPDLMTPAPGQGALAVQAREDDTTVRALLASIDDAQSRTATEAERALSARLGGGCDVPFGALATIADGRMTLRAAMATADGGRIARSRVAGPVGTWDRLVTEAEEHLVADGAREILGERS